MAALVPIDCVRPKWKSGKIVDKPAVHVLDEERNVLMLVDQVIDVATLEEYIRDALYVKRTRGPSAFGHEKPRYEVFYTPSGEPYRYSKIAHATIVYPQHVKDIIEKIKSVIVANADDLVPQFGQLDITGDILYDNTLPFGGSIGAHSDDERPWNIVVIFSLGQTRYLRLRNKKTRETYNVKMAHNSVVVMAGASFQSKYTHQVDRLSATEQVGTRLSLNIRYLPAKDVKRRRI